ncbi:MAG: EI24 domain-containing protein [Planctomycetales bacterium]
MYLRGVSRREKLARIRDRRRTALGLGASVFLLNFVPLLGSVLLTASVVGAVLLFRDLTDVPRAESSISAAAEPQADAEPE